MSVRMVLRMTARKEEDVVLGRRGNKVLRSLINCHSALFVKYKHGSPYSKDVMTPLFLSITKFCMRLWRISGDSDP